MLTIMSVAPIISVLAFSHIRKPAQNARRQLSRAARSMGRSMRRAPAADGTPGRLKYSQSTAQVGAWAWLAGSHIGASAWGGRPLPSHTCLLPSPCTQAAFATDAGSSMPPTPEGSAHGGSYGGPAARASAAPALQSLQEEA